MQLKASMRLRNAAMLSWRKAKDFTQADAAAFCNVSHYIWMRLEKLDYPKTYPEGTIYAIACATGIDIDKIMPEDLRGQNFGKTFSQEVEATNSQLHALASYQAHFCERALLPAPDEALAKKELTAALRKSVGTLNPYHQKIINMRYGLDGSKPVSRKVIAKKLKRSVAAINLAEHKALNHMKDGRRIHIVEPLL